MAAAARLSPIHVLIAHLQSDAVAIGVIIALGEIAVGLGTLLGLFARIAAVGGFVLSLSLFLTVSFHSSPYYTGSDIVFLFAWIPFVLVGSGGVLSLDAWISSAGTRHAARAAVPGATGIGAAGEGSPRREFVGKVAFGAIAAGVGLLIGGLAAGIGRLAGLGSTNSQTATLRPASGSTSASGGGSSGSSGAGRSGSPPGRAIGPATGVPVGGSAAFNDPATGDTSLVIQPVRGTFRAFDAICPHEGCTVQYFNSQGLFICPCHHSEFNARTGAVEAGPAPTGLKPIEVSVGTDGQLYAV